MITPVIFLNWACSNSWGTFWDTGSTASATKTPTFRRIYATNTLPNGALGGVTGADTTCSNDSNKPPGGSAWKAMVVQPGARIACSATDYCTSTAENTNWVLLPNTTYAQSDGVTKVGTTNSAGVFIFPLEAPFTPLTNLIWTGVRQTPAGWVAGSSITGVGGENCVNWTSTQGTDFAILGLGNSLTVTAINDNTPRNCGLVTVRILCAEQ